MTCARGTTNSNARGSAADRRARRAFLLVNWRADVDVIVGVDLNGDELVAEVAHGYGAPACRCYRCGALLTFDTVTIDRRIPGRDGGTYRRDNIRPACATCNSSTGGALARRPRKAA